MKKTVSALINRILQSVLSFVPQTFLVEFGEYSENTFITLVYNQQVRGTASPADKIASQGNSKG